MIDEELDVLLAAAACITDEQIGDLSLEGPAARLCEEIMSTPIIDNISTKESVRSKWNRRPRLIASLVATTIAIVGAGFLSFGGTDPVWAESLVQFSESSPQLLLGDEWEVSYADQGDGLDGEMTFTSDGHEIDLHWRSGGFERWASSRAHEASRVETVQVLNQSAQVSQYEGTDDFTALWPDGEMTVEFRTTIESFDEFVGLLGQLRKVDTDTWLSVMPDSVIQRVDHGAVVLAMLDGLPIRDPQDVVGLYDIGGIVDRYQLGVKVTKSVACPWIKQWVTAIDTGDAVAAVAASEAMGTAHQWPILREMIAQGDYSATLWDLADKVATNDSSFLAEVAEEYDPSLGCSD